MIPAMKLITGFFTCLLMNSAACSSASPPISPIMTIAWVSGSFSNKGSTSTNPVPFIYVSDSSGVALRKNGSLRDIAPTLLAIMGYPQPAEMSGHDLRIVGE